MHSDNYVGLARDIDPAFSFVLGFRVQLVGGKIVFDISDLVATGKCMFVYIETPTRRN